MQNMDRASRHKQHIDQVFWDLIEAGQRARQLTTELETVTTNRDVAIHRAWAEGISARAIAEATGLSHARVQQIVDIADDQAARATGLQPVTRQRRQDRERSRLLLAHLAQLEPR
jgi:response regulator of citrate/malate metabolism